MSASGELHRSVAIARQRPVWAAREGDPKLLDFNGFGYGQGILKFDAEVSDRTVHLGVA